MKFRFIILLLSAINLQSSLCAKISVEADASAFFPISSIPQQIYGHTWTDVAITFDHINFIPWAPCVNLFAMVNYIFASGLSQNGNEPTHIDLVPITLGIKWIAKVHEHIECYLGAAPRYYFMHIKNNSPYVPQTSNENGCGGFFTSGAFFYPQNHFMINVFFNFSYINLGAPASVLGVQSYSTNVSGFDLGVGIGWNF